MTSQTISRGNRFSAMILDHAFMMAIAVVFAVPTFIVNLSKAFELSHEQTSFAVYGDTIYIALVGFALYFCKDCIRGRSLAKRILNLQLIEHKTGAVASPWRCLVRNIFCILWPIEGFVALVNPSRRIGDWVAGTRLVVFDPATHGSRPQAMQAVASIALVYALSVPLGMAANRFERSAAAAYRHDERAYNRKESSDTQQLLQNNLPLLAADVRVYDPTDTVSQRYISIILRLSENLLANDRSFDRFNAKTRSVLYSRYPPGTFRGQAKYHYKQGRSIYIKTAPLR